MHMTSAMTAAIFFFMLSFALNARIAIQHKKNKIGAFTIAISINMIAANPSSNFSISFSFSFCLPFGLNAINIITYSKAYINFQSYIILLFSPGVIPPVALFCDSSTFSIASSYCKSLLSSINFIIFLALFS